MLIYISGVHSGPSPAPGIGVARCLRLAFPRARLIAVDYSPLSSGLNWPEFDGFRCFPDWNSVDFAAHTKLVRDLVAREGLWLAVSDREVRCLASELPDVQGIPNPPPAALAAIEKPAARAATLLDLLLPPLAPFENQWDLYTFCRRAGWNVWVKGLRGEALRFKSWPEFRTAVERLARTEGGRNGVFVQQHVEGRGEAVAFAAHSGKLLGAVAMIKRVASEGGKTWTGDIMTIPPAIETILRRFVAETEWTGGGEIEMIRDQSGGLWLMEVNPRFPAWIFGAALAGINLPALLVAAELGIEAPKGTLTSHIFTRTVIETPVRKEVAALMNSGQP
jgi:hypothetical protein